MDVILQSFLDFSEDCLPWTGNPAFQYYVGGIVWTTSSRGLNPRGPTMAEFDYNAVAELFPTRQRLPRHQSFGYKRFAQAAQAIRFAMEDMSPACLVGAFLEVDEQRYGSADIRRLYESVEFPLARRGARS
jgi:hypothetical protein